MSYIGELNADKEIIDGNRKIIIYGIGGYGDKIYRNLAIYDKQKNVMAFVDKSPERYKGGAFCSIPIISVEKAIKEYQDTINQLVDSGVRCIMVMVPDIAYDKNLFFNLAQPNVHFVFLDRGSH